MANLWVTEFDSMPVQDGRIGVPIFPKPIASQTKSFTTTTPVDTAADARTRFAAISADAAFHFNIGVGTPTATTANMRVPADTIIVMEYREGEKVAAVAAS